MIVNAYVLYKSLLIHKLRKTLSHYKFRHKVILAKLDPANYYRRETVVEKRVTKKKDQKYPSDMKSKRQQR